MTDLWLQGGITKRIFEYQNLLTVLSNRRKKPFFWETFGIIDDFSRLFPFIIKMAGCHENKNRKKKEWTQQKYRINHWSRATNQRLAIYSQIRRKQIFKLNLWWHSINFTAFCAMVNSSLEIMGPWPTHSDRLTPSVGFCMRMCNYKFYLKWL